MPIRVFTQMGVVQHPEWEAGDMRSDTEEVYVRQEGKVVARFGKGFALGWDVYDPYAEAAPKIEVPRAKLN